MPKLPKGMKQRGNAYYWRYRKHGKEEWVPLGSDYAAACQEMRKRKRLGTKVRSPLTVSELAGQWLQFYVPNGRNPKNQRLSQTRVARYIAPYFQGVRVADLRPRDLRAFRLWLETHPIKSLTVGAILGEARCMLRWAEDEGWVDRSPFPRRLLPRIQERPPDRLTDEEVRRILAVEEPYRYVMRLALATGMRWGELCRVCAEDYQDGLLVIHHTKTGRLRRVPVSRAFVDGRVGLLVGSKDPGVFARAIRRRTGIQQFHVHQTRHTFACRWLERGGSLAALQAILGHTTIVTTQRYGRVSEAHVRAEAERVGEPTGEVAASNSRKSLSAED